MDADGAGPWPRSILLSDPATSRDPVPDHDMSKRDYYEILGVARNASEEELKKAYRRCAMEHHPDRNPGDAAAEAAFKECKQAYEVHGGKRRMYDQHGHAAFEHGMGGGSSGPQPVPTWATSSATSSAISSEGAAAPGTHVVAPTWVT